MKLTTREKVLLGILAAVGLLALFYFTLFKPQMERVAILVAQDAVLKQEVQYIKSELLQENNLDKEIDTLFSKLQEKTVKFYPALLEEKIVLTLDELIKKSGITCNSNNFTDAAVTELSKAPADIGVKEEFILRSMMDDYKTTIGNDPDSEVNSGSNNDDKSTSRVESQEISLDYKGTYNQLTAFIKGLEALERTNFIKSITFISEGNGQITGNIRIEFVSIPKVPDQDKVYFEWPFNRQYGKDNPFIR